MKMLLKGDVEGFSVEQLVAWVSENFCQDKASLSGLEFLVAQVDNYGYEGYAYFLVRNQETGDYFEVDGSHCSCYGFEDQWKPKLAPTVYLISDLYKKGDEEVRNFVRSLFN